MATVDLHLHTTASDGTFTPTQLVRLAVARGLRIIAVTDHDTTNGLAEAFAEAERHPGLRVIPGIEINTDVPGEEVHVLGYFPQYDDPAFQRTLQRIRDGRVNRARRMVEKLADLGVHIDWERVVELAQGGSIGRPHIALALTEKGYVKEPKEAFDKYIGKDGPAYVEREKLLPTEAVQIVLSVGGVPVLAHPGDLRDPRHYIEQLKAVGLVGMEVYYARYTADQIAQLERLAEEYDLLPCGGSDFHGLGNADEPLPGELGPEPEVVEALERLAERARR